MAEKQVLDKAGIEEAIIRLSDGILRRNPNPSRLFIVGIKKRGDVLARKIVRRIESSKKKKVEMSALDITFYRDDVRLKAYRYVSKGEICFDARDRDVVLVDDVINTGRSIRAAIDAVIDSGRPRSIQLAVLIDRGGRELPIQPDYVGKKLRLQPATKVLVRLKEVDGKDQVIVQKDGK